MTNLLVSSLRAHLLTLKEEQEAGRAFGPQLLALPSIRWEQAMADHPEWLRVGTTRYLLATAKDLAQTDRARGRAITTFVLAHLKDVPEPPYGRNLIEPFKGEAFIAHGELLLASGDASGALQAAMIAEALLARILMGQMETAHAKLLRAKACGALERDAEALDLIDGCLRIYGAVGDALDYNRALLARAVLLCQMCQWAEAAHTLRGAQTVVRDMQYEERPAGELRDMIERCRAPGLPVAESGLGASGG